MINEIIQNILLENPLGVFSFFLLGILLVIFIQNIFFYFSNKDNAYLWYAVYALIILIDQLWIHYNVYYRNTFHHNLENIESIHPALEWLYNSAYLIFVIEFGGVFISRKRIAKIIKRIIFSLGSVLLVLLIIDLTQKTTWVYKGFLFLQVPMLVVLSIIILYHLFHIKTKVRNYIIPGSITFSVFSILAFITSIFDLCTVEQSWGLFYIGVFIENIFFSLGLVVKQKIVLKERNSSQKDLIIQLQENQELKTSHNEKLQEEVLRKTTEILYLNRKAEVEKIKKLEISFKKEIAEMKISSLQSQMNPHFIFNSLNSIKLYIIKNDKEKAVYYLNKFSKLIRKILSASREKEVSLSEEIDTIKLYANIENIRFKNEIKFSLNIQEGLNLSTIKIPPLILQPFIENAIWHGLSSKKGVKELHVNIEKNADNYIEISIIDNGIGRKKSTEIKNKKLHKKSSIGLKLTEERLLTFSKKFKNKHQLSIVDLYKDNKPIGTKIILFLPIN
jgi:sensor histidine kinase YesM